MFSMYGKSSITPCISQCCLDENDICVGCYRSLDEITDWVNKSEDEKIAITIRCKKQMSKRSAP